MAESEPQKGEALPTSEGASPRVPTRRPKGAVPTSEGEAVACCSASNEAEQLVPVALHGFSVAGFYVEA